MIAIEIVYYRNGTYNYLYIAKEGLAFPLYFSLLTKLVYMYLATTVQCRLHTITSLRLVAQ